LDETALLIPSARAGDLAADLREECLQIELLFRAEQTDQQRKATCFRIPPSANVASWNNLVFEDVGTFASSPGFFGTFDMTGSLFEWTEGINSPERILEGAGWDTQVANDLSAFFFISSLPTGEFNSFGFRVVSPDGE